MRDVAIIGVGHTKFGRASKTSLELFSEASLQAMDDAGVVGADIEALFQGAALPGFEEGQVMPAAFSAAELNLGPIPATRYEGACASASVASELNELTQKAAAVGLEALIELDRVSKDMIYGMDLTSASTLIGINNRDLDTLEVDVATFEQIAPEIKSAIPADVPLVAMSGINTKEEARRMFAAGADALLAGTSVMHADDIEQKVREFVRF